MITVICFFGIIVRINFGTIIPMMTVIILMIIIYDGDGDVFICFFL